MLLLLLLPLLLLLLLLLPILTFLDIIIFPLSASFLFLTTPQPNFSLSPQYPHLRTTSFLAGRSGILPLLLLFIRESTPGACRALTREDTWRSHDRRDDFDGFKGTSFTDEGGGSWGGGAVDVLASAVTFGRGFKCEPQQPHTNFERDTVSSNSKSPTFEFFFVILFLFLLLPWERTRPTTLDKDGLVTERTWEMV